VNTQPLLPGMIVSNEPGYYREGHWGIRIETLQVVTPADPIAGGERPMHGFEQLTFAPLDRRLIDADLLTPNERAYVDAYHAETFAKVGPLLDGEVKSWLEAQCRPL
jgi:Xaa-Pro aminopeptidase